MHEFRTGWLHAVDPGTANAGVASFYRGELKEVIKLRRPNPRDFATFAVGRPGCWVREMMQKYEKDRDKHKDLDAIEDLMNAHVNFLGRRFTARYRPSQWKGNIPKKIHHKRIKAALTEEELRLWVDDPDIIDAIGIGLYALGRIAKGGIPTGR